MKNIFDDLTPLKIIKFIIIFILIICLIKGAVWVYKDIAYGRFVDTNGLDEFSNNGLKIKTKGNKGFAINYTTSSIDIFEKTNLGEWALVKNIVPDKKGFTNSFTLDNGEIVLYKRTYNFSDKPTKLQFIIFDPEKDSIKKAAAPDLIVNNFFDDLITTSDNGFLYRVCEKTCKMYKYNYKQNLIQEIKNPFKDDKRDKKIYRYQDDTLLFLYGAYSLAVNRFDYKTNKFKKLDTDVVNKPVKEPYPNIQRENCKIHLLSDNRFLFIRKAAKGLNDTVNIISLYKINENEVEEIFTKVFKNLKIDMQNSGFVEIEKDKILILGGSWGVWASPFFDTYQAERKDAFILDLKRQKITKINNMKYERANSKGYKIDENKIYIYSETDINHELFKKGKLW